MNGENKRKQMSSSMFSGFQSVSQQQEFHKDLKFLCYFLQLDFYILIATCNTFEKNVNKNQIKQNKNIQLLHLKN